MKKLIFGLIISLAFFQCEKKQTFNSPVDAPLLFMSNKSGNADIYKILPGSSEWINLTNSPAAENWGSWSPDGSKIVYQSRVAGNLDIWVMNADGSDAKQLTDNPAHDYLPAWTPDGKSISFTTWRVDSPELKKAPQIYIMNADGANQRKLVDAELNTSSGASWAPDGKTFVFSRKLKEEGADIFLAAADGKIIAQLTDDPIYNGSATFSPNGQQIAFYSDTGESSSIVVMNVDGTDKHSMISTGKNWYPRWSGDGKWIVFTVAQNPENENDLDLLAISVEDTSKIVSLVDGNGREAEGVWLAGKQVAENNSN